MNMTYVFRKQAAYRSEGGRLGRSVQAIIGVICLITVADAAIAAPVSQQTAPANLVYDAQTQGPVPIPPSERNLQTVLAEPWFKASNKGLVLEGAIFDRNGNMLFCDVTGRRILRLTPDKQLSVVTKLDKMAPGGLAFHKDGRLFIAALDLTQGVGAIVAVKPDGTEFQTILAPEAGYLPNDLVFDVHGGFYFSDFRGTSTQPKGGIYYVSPDGRAITSVLPNLSMANGVALSPDGKELWATEFGRNLLHRIELATATTITPIGSTVAYQFTGPAPDSMRIDADGNVYVAIYGQGRVLVFNRNGIPIGQVLLPGRERGHNLQSTSLAIRPDTNDLDMVTSDGEGGEGAMVFHAGAFAHGLPQESTK